MKHSQSSSAADAIYMNFQEQNGSKKFPKALEKVYFESSPTFDCFEDSSENEYEIIATENIELPKAM